MLRIIAAPTLRHLKCHNPASHCNSTPIRLVGNQGWFDARARLTVPPTITQRGFNWRRIRGSSLMRPTHIKRVEVIKNGTTNSTCLHRASRHHLLQAEVIHLRRAVGTRAKQRRFRLVCCFILFSSCWHNPSIIVEH
ncbi:hypothetical protein KCP69_16020 [Salmonella enterica subsp. enterica]|nr:hypothetical protein KCP69_16020 [Salmonella enterica subsp. enterica]